MLVLVLVAGCAKPTPPPPARPTIGVAVPLSGPDATSGEAAVRAVQLAVGNDFAVKAVDDTQPDAVATLTGTPEVFAAVVHVKRETAEATAPQWLTADLPVISAAPGDYRGLARVVPPIEDSARCASILVADHDFWIRSDGIPAGLRAATAMSSAAPRHSLGLQSVDPGEMSVEAARLKKRHHTAAVVWTGAPGTGGNFLRTLRTVGMNAPFVGIGLYDPAFLTAAGKSAEGAIVTSEGRGARDRAFVERYEAAAGAAPPISAVDAYDATMLLVAAWQLAAADGMPVARDAIRRALPNAVAEGASGSMYLDADGIVHPVLCASFRVVNGAFELDAITSEADGIPEKETPSRRRR